MKLKFKKPSLATIEKGFGLGASIAISALIIVKCAMAIKSCIQQPKKKMLVVVSDNHEESKKVEQSFEEAEKHLTIPEDPNPTSDGPVEEEKPVDESSKALKKTTKK